MAYPLSLSFKITYPVDNVDKEKFVSGISSGNISNFKNDNDNISFELHKSLIYTIQTVNLRIKENIENYLLTYEISMIPVIKFIVIVLILTSFSSFFSVTLFIVFSIVFSFSVYHINYFFQKYYLISLIETNTDELSEVLSDEQKKWIKDPGKCPACGNEISEYQQNCFECGLKLREKTKFSRFTSSKGFNKINYLFKK